MAFGNRKVHSNSAAIIRSGLNEEIRSAATPNVGKPMNWAAAHSSDIMMH
jgi:hypothetical protein